MNTDLRTHMQDLVSDVPEHLPLDELPRTAWAAGRRRRVRRRVLTAGAALAVFAIVAGGVLSLLRGPGTVQPASRDAHVTGYPQRITDQWWTPALPDRPGPVAGLLVRPDGHWDVISQHGHLWRSPQPLIMSSTYPTVSPDGRFLGYLAGNNGPFVIRDLVTGHTRSYAGIDCGCSSPGFTAAGTYWWEGGTPAFWSPDESRLVIEGGSDNGAAGGALLLEPDGRVRLLTQPVTGHLAGWASPRALIWVSGTRRTDQGKAVDVRITNIDGRRLRTIRLQLPDAVGVGAGSQWTWTASPDGRRLLLMGQPDARGAGFVATYSLRDGALLTTGRVPGIADSCPSGWAGGTPVVPALAADGAAQTVTASRPPKPLVVSDPRLGSYCLIWAVDALAGTAHAGLFGTATATWTWWWPEALLGVGGVAVVVLILRRTAARRTQRDT